MKRTGLIVLLILTVVAATFYFSTKGPEDDSAYISSVLKERKSKEDYLKKGEGSPFIVDSLVFDSLRYFPINKEYQVKADLEPIDKKKVFILGTSDGKEQRYLEHAYAVFTLDGITNKLLILEVMDNGPQRGKLFLAFADETSGADTYGAGRYLDIEKVRGANSIVLDFNLAYNPYCAYSDTFSCPLPPRENILKVAIRAGEKSYH